MPSSESTITNAMPKTTVVVMLLSSVPRLFARWARRLKACGLARERGGLGAAYDPVDRLGGEPADHDGAEDDDQDRERLADQPGRSVGQRLVAGPVVDGRTGPAVALLAGGRACRTGLGDGQGTRVSESM